MTCRWSFQCPTAIGLRTVAGSTERYCFVRPRLLNKPAHLAPATSTFVGGIDSRRVAAVVSVYRGGAMPAETHALSHVFHWNWPVSLAGDEHALLTNVQASRTFRGSPRTGGQPGRETEGLLVRVQSREPSSQVSGSVGVRCMVQPRTGLAASRGWRDAEPMSSSSPGIG
jgi:hypothetical protein